MYQVAQKIQVVLKMTIKAALQWIRMGSTLEFWTTAWLATDYTTLLIVENASFNRKYK